MRTPALLSLILGLAILPVDAQTKRKGIFGVGSDTDQISSGLFPNSPSGPTTNYTAPTSSSTPDRAGEDGIFRGGGPSDVEAVSYVIQDGERVEREAAPKKRGLFSFGKKTEETDAPAIAPVPASEYTPANVIPLDAEPTNSITQVREEVAEEVADINIATMEAVNEPIIEEKKKTGGGLFGLFGKKSEEIPEVPAFAMENPAEPVEAPAVATPAASAPATEAPAAPVAANPYEATSAPEATTPAPAPVVAEPTPDFASGSPEAKPEKDGFRLANPIAAIRNRKEDKPVDLTGAETIISNGQIVGESEDIVESNRVETGDGVRQPPRVIDGVTTYSSWDDVNARSVSAADKILNQIR